ncbi:hypothetical protein ACO1O0_007535 [Amphichorda felina]
MDNEPKSTPKRKRGVNTAITPIKFSFDPTQAVSEDGNDSPRSKVAHRFRGLALEGEGGSGVAPTTDDDDADLATRKRQRPDVDMTEVPEGPVVAVADSEGEAVPQPDVPGETSSKPPGEQPPEGTLQSAYPSINRPSESRSRRGRKRIGTPPPRLRKKAAVSGGEGQADDDEMEIVEPVRAALTWRDDEITVYDPNDADDDGTGINGVGFRPTPALAHARVMKRRLQMAEYRKREESEARARRSQRRHGHNTAAASPEKSPQSRKVRFIEENNRSYFSATP